MKMNGCLSLLLAAFLVTGCQSGAEDQEMTTENNSEQENTTENENTKEKNNEDVEDTAESVENNEETQKTDEEMIKEKADEILTLLKNKDIEKLTEYVHPEKGLLFSPYVYVEENAVTFKKDQVENFMNDEEEYMWGNEDGSGHPIELTPAAYYDKYIYDASFDEEDEIVFNPKKARGNMIRNVKEIFPGAHVVEYYVKGTEEYDNMDWKALNLAFEQDESGEWKLVAIVHDQWTI
ncbi:hypothetical protein [Metabacillus litoralis]|uniref:hypothetical protein n=1 Tax=Metabacillus litoralis TaxID=152268 RepID=UPI001CFDEB10|nr:hypothetical protein [Metabacillus litoralis]